MNKITKIVGRQIFDSRGNPTIEAEVFCNSVSCKAILHLVLPLVHMKLMKKEIFQIKNIREGAFYHQ